jgi:protein-disulfide isomerase
MAADAEPPRPGGGAFAGWKTALLGGAAGLLIGAGAVALSSGHFVRAYLLEHPEVIPEAMQRLEARELGKAVALNRAAYETPFAGAWAGNERGDVVLVEFFDYACGYCRRSNADIDRLLKEDPKLKVVWREWPVLGPDSEAAAEVSLAAARQGRFREFYATMFARGRPDAETLAQAQREAGVSPQAVAALRGSSEARQELARNYQLARAINASGTPTFVVGDRVLQGAVGYAALKAAIAEARN